MDRREGQTEPGPEPRKVTKTEAKWVIAGILAILFGVFIAQNSIEVEVHFVFFKAGIRLIWVFLLCGVIGGIIDRLLQRRGIL
jgi:uncharacterized integral membrane protein